MHTVNIEWKKSAKSIVLSLLMLISAFTTGLDSLWTPPQSLEDSPQSDWTVGQNVWGNATFLATAGSVGKYSSVATDSNNFAHISYHDTTNKDLIYATDSSGAWTFQTIDSAGNNGWYTAIAVAANDSVHISYYDKDNTNLKYATNSGGSWTTTVVHSTGDVGKFSSIAIDNYGMGQISYYDATNQDLRYAYQSPDYMWQANVVVDSTGDVGKQSSIAIKNNKAHIAYCDETNGYLKYAEQSSYQGSWTTYTAHTNNGDIQGNENGYISIAIDSNENAHISYFNNGGGDLLYATDSSGSWVPQWIDNNGNTGQYSSLALDSNDNVHISYADASNNVLRYATNSTGSWVTSTIDSNSSVGRYTSLAIDSTDNLHVSYWAHGGANDLKYIRTYTPASSGGGSSNVNASVDVMTDFSNYSVGDTVNATIDSSNLTIGEYYSIWWILEDSTYYTVDQGYFNWTANNNWSNEILTWSSLSGENYTLFIYLDNQTTTVNSTQTSFAVIPTGCGYEEQYATLNTTTNSQTFLAGEDLNVTMESDCNMLGYTMHLTYAMSNSSLPSGTFDWTANNLADVHYFEWLNVIAGTYDIYVNLGYYNAAGTLVGLGTDTIGITVSNPAPVSVDVMTDFSNYSVGDTVNATINSSNLIIGDVYFMYWVLEDSTFYTVDQGDFNWTANNNWSNEILNWSSLSSENYTLFVYLEDQSTGYWTTQTSFAVVQNSAPTGCGYEEQYATLNTTTNSQTFLAGEDLNVTMESDCNMLGHTMHLTYAMSNSSLPSGTFDWTANNLADVHYFEWLNVTAGTYDIYVNLGYYNATGTLVGLGTDTIGITVSNPTPPSIWSYANQNSYSATYPGEEINVTINVTGLQSGDTFIIDWYLYCDDTSPSTFVNLGYQIIGDQNGEYPFYQETGPAWASTNSINNGNYKFVTTLRDYTSGWNVSTNVQFAVDGANDIQEWMNSNNSAMSSPTYEGDYVSADIGVNDLEYNHSYRINWDLYDDDSGALVDSGNDTWYQPWMPSTYARFHGFSEGWSWLAAGNYTLYSELDPAYEWPNPSYANHSTSFEIFANSSTGNGYEWIEAGGQYSYTVGDTVNAWTYSHDLVNGSDYVIYWWVNDTSNGGMVVDGYRNWTANYGISSDGMPIQGLGYGQYSFNANLYFTNTTGTWFVDGDSSNFVINNATGGGYEWIVTGTDYTTYYTSDTVNATTDSYNLINGSDYSISWTLIRSATQVDNGHRNWTAMNNWSHEDYNFSGLTVGWHCFYGDLYETFANGSSIYLDSDNACFDVINNSTGGGSEYIIAGVGQTMYNVGDNMYATTDSFDLVNGSDYSVYWWVNDTSNGNWVDVGIQNWTSTNSWSGEYMNISGLAAGYYCFNAELSLVNATGTWLLDSDDACFDVNSTSSGSEYIIVDVGQTVYTVGDAMSATTESYDLVNGSDYSIYWWVDAMNPLGSGTMVDDGFRNWTSTNSSSYEGISISGLGVGNYCFNAEISANDGSWTYLDSDSFCFAVINSNTEYIITGTNYTTYYTGDPVFAAIDSYDLNDGSDYSIWWNLSDGAVIIDTGYFNWTAMSNWSHEDTGWAGSSGLAQGSYYFDAGLSLVDANGTYELDWDYCQFDVIDMPSPLVYVDISQPSYEDDDDIEAWIYGNNFSSGTDYSVYWWLNHYPSGPMVDSGYFNWTAVNSTFDEDMMFGPQGPGSYDFAAQLSINDGGTWTIIDENYIIFDVVEDTGTNDSDEWIDVAFGGNSVVEGINHWDSMSDLNVTLTMNDLDPADDYYFSYDIDFLGPNGDSANITYEVDYHQVINGTMIMILHDTSAGAMLGSHEFWNGCWSANFYLYHDDGSGGTYVLAAEHLGEDFTIGVGQSCNWENWDSDGDGYNDTLDQFPFDSNEWNDTDMDGVGDNSDAFPNNYSESSDTDGDGLGDNSDTCPDDADNDADGDGICGDVDICPYDADDDADGDGICGDDDICPFDDDDDADGDGICGDVDACPLDATNNCQSTNNSVGISITINMDSRVIMTNEGEELQISADDGWASVTVELTNLVVGEEYTRDYLMVDHSVSPHVNMYCNNWPSEITSGPCGFDSTFTAQYSSIFVVTHFPALEDSTQACLEIDISDSSGSIATEIGCWNQQSISDWDNDGVIDLLDTCGDTPVGTIVNANGCVETIAMPDTAPTCWVGYWVGTAGTPQNNWNWTEKMSGWNEFDAPDNGEFTLALPKGDYYVYFGCWDAQEDSITLSVAGLPVTREFEADVSWVWGWDEFSITDNEVGNQHDMVITWSSTDFGGTVTIHFEGVETVADSVAESDSGGLPGFPASLALVSLLGAAVILSRRKD